MHLKLYDSYDGRKKSLALQSPTRLNLYVCGMTVYDRCHIGHARTMLVFDAFVRYMHVIGIEVNYVRNITDIDDKIIKRSMQLNEDWRALTSRYIEAMNQDAKKLGLLEPKHQPKATDHIDAMISMIETLMVKGYAYVAEHGDVCYDVRAFDSYGKLSNRRLDDLKAGHRVDIDHGKRHPFDFVLWKLAKEGEPSWSSPWGEGRPGWHIECSAMNASIFGPTIDLHGGGFDLLFPHHENEIAQSQAAHDCCFAKHWMHVGFLQINDEKMSKSLNNFITIEQALVDHHPQVIRLMMLQTHYRSPCSYDDERLRSAKSIWLKWSKLIGSIKPLAVHVDRSMAPAFFQALDDDFNTPLALTVLSAMAKDIRNQQSQGVSNEHVAQQAGIFVALLATLGIVLQHEHDGRDNEVMHQDEIQDLIERRNQARSQKDWAKADAIRAQLEALGIDIKDS